MLWDGQEKEVSIAAELWEKRDRRYKEKINFIHKTADKQNDIFAKYLHSQNKLLQYNGKGSQSTYVKSSIGKEHATKVQRSYEVRVMEAKPKSSESLQLEPGIIFVYGDKNEQYSAIESVFLEKGMILQWIEKKETDSIPREFEECKEKVSGILFLVNDGTDYTQFEHIYFYLKHWTNTYRKKQDRKNRNNRLLVMGISFQDGYLGYKGTCKNAVQGSLSGLLKSYKREVTAEVEVKMLDFSPNLQQDKFKSMLKEELEYANSNIEIGRDITGGRYSLGAIEQNQKEMRERCVNEKDVFVVTGGGKGITAECMVALCEKAHCKFIILGRSKLLEEKEEIHKAQSREDLIKELYVQNDSKKKKLKPVEIESAVQKILSSRQIRKTLERIQNSGGKAYYYCCDIMNPESVASVIDEAEASIGKITGVIHGAGVIRDALLEKKTKHDFQTVYGTKCIGIQNILNALDVSSLRFISLFSSIASYQGNKGQTDYASGNEYLNKLAYQLRHRLSDCAVLAINWGPWDGGMVNETLRTSIEKQGHHLILLEEGTQYFVDQFYYQYTPGVSQIVIWDNVKENGGLG